MAFPLPILPDPRDAGFMAWVQLARTYSKMTRCLEQLLDHHGITLPQFDVLATLSVGEDITQQDLAQRLLVTKGNVCGVLNRMEKNLWVERRTDAHDRRSNRLFLTIKGRRLLAKVLPAHEALIARVVRPLLPSDSQQLYQLLERLENALDAIPPETRLVPPKQDS